MWNVIGVVAVALIVVIAVLFLGFCAVVAAIGFDRMIERRFVNP